MAVGAEISASVGLSIAASVWGIIRFSVASGISALRLVVAGVGTEASKTIVRATARTGLIHFLGSTIRSISCHFEIGRMIAAITKETKLVMLGINTNAIVASEKTRVHRQILIKTRRIFLPLSTNLILAPPHLEVLPTPWMMNIFFLSSS